MPTAAFHANVPILNFATAWYRDTSVAPRSTTLNKLISAAFTIRHVQEWAPTADQVERNPELGEEMERPMILIVSAQR